MIGPLKKYSAAIDRTVVASSSDVAKEGRGDSVGIEKDSELDIVRLVKGCSWGGDAGY